MHRTLGLVVTAVLAFAAGVRAQDADTEAEALLQIAPPEPPPTPTPPPPTPTPPVDTPVPNDGAFTPSPVEPPAFVQGHKIISWTGPKRFFSAEPSSTGCGFERDGIAELPGGLAEKAPVVVTVPCVESESGFAPGPPMVRRTDKGPPARLTDDELPPGHEPVFMKGELTSLGSVWLQNARESIGIGVGFAGIDDKYYVVLRPDLNGRIGPFRLGLGAPLRVQVLDTSRLNLADPASYGTLTDGAGNFRQQDWDQIEDFLRPLRYATWGRKEDKLFVDINHVHAQTLGHGQLMRRYQPNVDIDQDRLVGEIDAYGDWGGVEVVAGPFPIPRVAGALVFVKPLAFLDDYVSKSFSIGATYVTDLNAPTALVKDLSIPGQPEIAVDNDGRFFWRHRDSFIGERVRGAGVDAELKVYKWEMLDVKVYADYSHLFLPGVPEENVAAFSDGGFTVGGLLRMSIGERYARKLAEEDEDTLAGVMPRELRADHAFRFRLEARTFGPQYLPSYFNTLYEVDRLQFGGLGGNRAALPTKIGALAANAGQPWRAGFYLEGSYTFVDVLGVTALYEDAYALGAGNVVGGRNFALHVESAGLGWLQLFASYHFRNFDSIAGLFSFSTDNEIFFAGGRLMILPILWLNVTGQRAFRVGFGDNDGGVRKLPGQGAGTPSFRFSSIGMQNQWAGTVELELGWQF